MPSSSRQRRPAGWRALLGGALVALCINATSARAGLPGLPQCAGDCDGNRQVGISELVRGLRIALGEDPISRCPAIDLDNDGTVSINDLVVAVNAALLGCPTAVGPTPTATNTGPPTVPADTPTATQPVETATATSTVDTPTHTAVPQTATRTPSSTATQTGTPSDTPTLTPTESPSATPTASPTLSPTPRATPPLSARLCGNGNIEPGEECDDDNLTPGDGCSALCRTESHANPCAGIAPVAGTGVKAVRVASGLAQPLHATSAPGDLTRLFIVEQTGRIRILKNGVLLPTPFLDLRSRVIAGGERGLLGLAFHPHYATNGEFFVDYTSPRGTALVSVISRFHVTDNPDIANPDSEEVLIEQDQPYVAHNGGQLAFDAAGYLYIGFGDGGQSAVIQNTAQDRTTWLGKILRIDVDGGTPYAIPADNPYVGPADGTLDEIWAMGLRNPWRFSFDRANGNMYIGDVGDGSREEIDVALAGDSGLNFGWCCREGNEPFPRCFRAAMTCPTEGLVSPVIDYPHSEGCSVSGGFVYRGCALPDLHGTYFYADYCNEFIRSFVYNNGVAENQHDWTAQLDPGNGMTIDRIVAFGEDGRGELYISDIGGEVFKIVPAVQ